MPTDKDGNDLPPGPGERGDALVLIKEYARKGHAQTGGKEEDFEDLWRTAFSLEDTKPDSKD